MSWGCLRPIARYFSKPLSVVQICRRLSNMSDEQYIRRESVNQSTLFDYMGSTGIDVNLKMGTPGEEQLKKSSEILKKAAVHRLEQPDAHLLFQYGPEAGDFKFLQEVARFLSREYQVPVDVNNLIATAGATQGLSMLGHLLFSPGDLVFVENPTYFIAIRMLEHDAGFKCVPSPMDGDGIIPEELEKTIQAHLSIKPREMKGNKPFWSMLYLIPTFHNPTGTCLSPERCKKIVRIARKYNLLVVCDDVYNLLYFSEDPSDSLYRKRLFAYDDPNDPDYKGNVISNGSFSKIFGPGIRLGWLEVPPNVKDIITTSGLALSGGGLNHTTSGLMTSVISLGLLKDHLNKGRQLYKSQSEAVCAVLRKKLPSATFKNPQGGYFLWVKLPHPLKAADVLQRCEQEKKITFFTGDLASPTSQFGDHIRISFSYYDTQVLTSAVEKLTDVVNTMIREC